MLVAKDYFFQKHDLWEYHEGSWYIFYTATFMPKELLTYCNSPEDWNNRECNQQTITVISIIFSSNYW